MRRDTHSTKPEGMAEYLETYGWHFSKPMCTWAVSNMRDRSGQKVKMHTKEEIKNMLDQYGMNIDAKGYDDVYIAAMARADYYGGTITTEAQLARFLSDYFNDEDGYFEKAFTRFYADCIAKDEPIIWGDMI